MKANEKLIHALEQEEKRLLDNEQRYAEEVKRLKDELDSTKLILETANAKVSIYSNWHALCLYVLQMLDDESTISTLNDALRFEKDAVIVLEGRLRDTTGRADEFSKELREVKVI